VARGGCSSPSRSTTSARPPAYFRPAYEDSRGSGGFISFECTPDLADVTGATIAQATSLWQRLAQPNVMIKVPGTAAGLPAIEELTRCGVNINITLLFSAERYEQVIDVYLRGLAKRADAGEPVDTIASVASFFLSRIDTKTDARLGAGTPAARSRSPALRRLPALPGQVRRSRLERLRDLGARPQRPLWASTGTKNPEYSDVRYVAELIGPDVINTMPEHTLRAFADYGTVARTLDADPNGAGRMLAAAAAAGLALAAVTARVRARGRPLVLRLLPSDAGLHRAQDRRRSRPVTTQHPLAGWYRAGEDVGVLLPRLSAYLGHRDPVPPTGTCRRPRNCQH
jgi:transaldolase